MKSKKDKDAAKQEICDTVCCDLMAVECIRASSAYYKLKLTAQTSLFTTWLHMTPWHTGLINLIVQCLLPFLHLVLLTI